MNLFEGIASKAEAMVARCESGTDPDACLQLRGSPLLNMMQGGKPSQSQLMKEAARLNLLPKRMAEGGEVEEEMGGFMSPPEAAMEADMEMEMGEADPDYMALAEIFGEEGWMQIQEAMAQYPAVIDLAEMAIQTSDGYVEGEGGPKEDMVPARLSDGEFVISAEAVDVIGLDKLEKLHEEAKRIAASK